jgi:hypothetical protein
VVPEAQKEASGWALMEEIYKLVLLAFNNLNLFGLLLEYLLQAVLRAAL